MNEEFGVYHNDLHYNNHMIHRETGLPVLIDFGASIVKSGKVDARLREKDIKKVLEAYGLMKEYLKKKARY